MYSLLLQPLSAENPYSAEVAFFGARALHDVLVDEEINDVNRPYLDSLLTFALTQDIARTSFALAKGICGFVNEYAK